MPIPSCVESGWVECPSLAVWSLVGLNGGDEQESGTLSSSEHLHGLNEIKDYLVTEGLT